MKKIKKEVAMSSNNYVYLRNLKKGRTYLKVKVRVIREWRVIIPTGEFFKGYNLLLLDAKVRITMSNYYITKYINFDCKTFFCSHKQNIRIVAYVPEWLS